jgi:hypothetical protein
MKFTTMTAAVKPASGTAPVEPTQTEGPLETP